MASLDIALLARLGEAPKRIRLLRSTTTIGRDKSSLIYIDDTYISRKHAVIIKRHGLHYVRNLSRTSGTWLNGAALLLPPLAVFSISDRLSSRLRVSESKVVLYCVVVVTCQSRR